MPVGTIFLGLCMVALGGVNAVWQFFLIALFARAIGQPIFIGLLPRTMAVNFFQRRRNIALAFTSLVRPVASAINIQVILAIAASKGLAGRVPLSGLCYAGPDHPYISGRAAPS